MNMRLFEILSISLGFQLLTLPAIAAPIDVVPATSEKEAAITTRVDTDNIGMLKIPRGSTKIKGDSVSIGAIPEWLFDRHTVLKGKILKSRIEGTGSSTQVRGLVYFMSGDWINNLDNIKRRDNLFLESGQIYVGKVRAINEDTVDFQLVTGQVKRLKKNSIAKLISPRAYFFQIPLTSQIKIDSGTKSLSGEAETIAYHETVKSNKKSLWFARKKPEEPKSLLAGTEGGVTKTQIAGMLFLDIANTIAPAVIIPIVSSPLGSRSAETHLREFQQREDLLLADDFAVIP